MFKIYTVQKLCISTNELISILHLTHQICFYSNIMEGFISLEN